MFHRFACEIQKSLPEMVGVFLLHLRFILSQFRNLRTTGCSKKNRFMNVCLVANRNEQKNSLMTALRGLGLFLISYPLHAFTCASITGQTITITNINQVNCAAGEVAFLEAADLTSWQTLLVNAVLASQPFDYVLAGAFWAFAFSFTVGVWFFTKNISLIFQSIKSW